MMIEWVSIDVRVPGERIPDFYRMFSSWLSAEENAVPQSTQQTAKSWFDGDRSSEAVKLLNSVTPFANRILTFLMYHPGQPISAEELAKKVGLPSPRVMTGSLKSVGVQSRRLGLELPYFLERTVNGSMYWMDHAVAQTLKRAYGFLHQYSIWRIEEFQGMAPLEISDEELDSLGHRFEMSDPLGSELREEFKQHEQDLEFAWSNGWDQLSERWKERLSGATDDESGAPD
jgi:hypothetical protein